MDVRHLTYFIEVARHRSFTKAAQALHITQPSISKMVKILEEELDVTLFNRNAKQAELTDAGKAVLRQAQQIVHSFHNLTSELSDVINLKKGNIIIGLPPMVGVSFFPSIIGEFNHLYPQITLKLIEVGSKQIEHGVEDGSLDIGVVALPVKEELFNMFAFVKEPLKLIVHPSHHLADKDTAHFSELRKDPFVLFREDFTIRDRILERCNENGFYPKIVCESSQWDFIAEMVAAKLGIALLPDTIAKELSPKRIKLLSLEPEIPWNLAIIWRKDKYLSFAAREWLKFTSSRFNVKFDLRS
ncbi:cidABC operon transcriptional activator CidR [Dendrosporobacter sp. 1207_IL3150]|uniref:cidABC operon transcriptional activator CidR n=1 Tax=Dendrosporobacter sp. 1207_IL3150 TaxID=3084054 RepID=UPI002FDAF17F